MSEELVKIKGSKDGLSLSFASGASFADIRQHLQEKLESGSGFFLRGTMVFLPRDVLNDEQREILQKMFYEHGLICRIQPLEGGRPAEKTQNAANLPGIYASSFASLHGTSRTPFLNSSSITHQ
jgi:septum site-determining protein MinC